MTEVVAGLMGQEKAQLLSFKTEWPSEKPPHLDMVTLKRFAAYAGGPVSEEDRQHWSHITDCSLCGRALVRLREQELMASQMPPAPEITWDQMQKWLADASDPTKKPDESSSKNSTVPAVTPQPPDTADFPPGSTHESGGNRNFWQTINILAVAAGLALIIGVWRVSGPTTQQPPPGETTEAHNLTSFTRSDKIAPETVVMAQGSFPTGWRRGGLFVGVSTYADSKIHGLRNAKLDALTASEKAVSLMGADRKNVLYLGDALATECAVRAALLHLRQFNRPQDMLILYFACHAGPDLRGDLRFQLHDSTATGGLAGREILELLGAPPGRVLLVADVCYSGQLVSNGWGLARHWVLASATAQEQAFEAPSGTVFGANWFQALAGKGDSNGDGSVTIDEAFAWTSAQMQVAAKPQHPVLSQPSDAPPLIVSLRQDLLSRLPSPAKGPPGPAVVRLMIPGSQKVGIELDGQKLGEAVGPALTLPVSSGEHDLVVRWTPLWDHVAGHPLDEWRARFSAAEGESSELHVLLKPLALRSIPVLAEESPSLFGTVVRNPATEMVSAACDEEGAYRFAFAWDTRSMQSERVASAAFAADVTKGIDVPTLMGLTEASRLELTFDARGSKGGERVTFFCGGVGVDSLAARATLKANLTVYWTRFTIPLPTARLRQLVGGFGVEVDATENAGEPLLILVRDAKISVSVDGEAN
jgi:hypothetical protein